MSLFGSSHRVLKRRWRSGVASPTAAPFRVCQLSCRAPPSARSACKRKTYNGTSHDGPSRRAGAWAGTTPVLGGLCRPTPTSVAQTSPTFGGRSRPRFDISTGRTPEKGGDG